MTKIEWQAMRNKLEANNRTFATQAELGKFLGISQQTVSWAIIKGYLSDEWITSDPVDKYTFTESDNQAKLDVNSEHPMTIEQLMEIAGIDQTEWRVDSQSVGMWQIGRSNKQVDIEWVDGKMSGSVTDDGKINKDYLYKYSLKLTRINPEPISPIVRPIEIKKTDVGPFRSIRDHSDEAILFICDPHFGFVKRDGYNIPFHNRQFLSDLLELAAVMKPEHIVWNGDFLDLADFSTYPDDPNTINKTQMAAIEGAWILEQFGRHTWNQVILEGNHDVRFEKAMMKNFAPAYGLKSVNELDGQSLLSIPKLLNLKELKVQWVDGYPNNFYDIGPARFIHGNIARNGMAKTIAAMGANTVKSTFFGHIHRYELASKYIEDIGTVWIGSPGCATSFEFTPGVRRDSNWSHGAFFISMKDGLIKSVEHINHTSWQTWFRGVTYGSEPYFDSFIESLPKNWKGEF